MTVLNDRDVEIMRLDQCLRRLARRHHDPVALANALRNRCLRRSEEFFQQLSRDNGCTVEQWGDRLASEVLAMPDLYDRCTDLFTDCHERALLEGIVQARRVTGRQVPIRIHIFAGLFECTGVAYDSNIGFALETFLPQDALRAYGLPDEKVAICQAQLDDIPVMAAHEYGHAAHVCQEDTLAAKVIEEGIAVLTSIESVPGYGMDRYLLMESADIEWCSAHERQLFTQFTSDIDRVDWKTKRSYFGTATEAPVPGAPARVGYYLGMRVCQNYLRQTGAGIPELLGEEQSHAVLTRSGITSDAFNSPPRS